MPRRFIYRLQIEAYQRGGLEHPEYIQVWEDTWLSKLGDWWNYCFEGVFAKDSTTLVIVWGSSVHLTKVGSHWNYLHGEGGHSLRRWTKVLRILRQFERHGKKGMAWRLIFRRKAMLS